VTHVQIRAAQEKGFSEEEGKEVEEAA